MRAALGVDLGLVPLLSRLFNRGCELVGAVEKLTVEEDLDYKSIATLFHRIQVFEDVLFRGCSKAIGSIGAHSRHILATFEQNIVKKFKYRRRCRQKLRFQRPQELVHFFGA